ncbi:Mbov_0283/Mbov_0339 family surface lipoprotein, partial [Mycoplasmopsis bovis]
DSESNSENQDSKTDGSRHESTTPSESTQNDIPTENYKIDDYLNRVKTYGKEANLLITLLAGAWTENYDELQKKYASLWPIVTEFFKLHEKIVSKFDEIKKEIEEFFGKPESKNNKLDNLLKQYEKSRDEIKDAIEVLKRLQKK